MAKFSEKEIHQYNSLYASPAAQEYEAAAEVARNRVLEEFPKKDLKNLNVDDYAIGRATNSFCALIEAKSRVWANIQGANSFKFGIYYGKTKSDPVKKYRAVKRFGGSKAMAFKNVKISLLSLIDAGRKRDFEAIDSNPLSQMVKAKILSLYYPNVFINICSKGHILAMTKSLSLQASQYTSENQHLILKVKLEDERLKHWSNPKFMNFLYYKFMPKHSRQFKNISLKKPSIRNPKRVNMQEVQDERNRIGERSEKFTLDWEKRRLKGLGYDHLVDKIEDVSKAPGYGYDIKSFDEPGKRRCIEVKTLAKKQSGYRFFLSSNEFVISKGELQKSYYFYLVSIGSDGYPKSLRPLRSKVIHDKGRFVTAVYEVLIDFDD